jgi:hypothetical protein
MDWGGGGKSLEMNTKLWSKNLVGRDHSPLTKAPKYLNIVTLQKHSVSSEIMCNIG